MKFGFGRVPQEDLQSHIKLIQLGEQLGFDYSFTSDQTFFPDPYIYLAAIGQATTRIHIGISVTNPFTRHPAITARAIGTVDKLAPGRVLLGIGGANRKELIDPLGLDGTRTAQKIKEMVEIVKGLLSNKRLEYHGDHFNVDGVKLNFNANPNINVFVAARGPLILHVAGEVADGAKLGAFSQPGGLKFALNEVRKGTESAGRDLSELEIFSWVFTVITDDRQAGLDAVRHSAAHIVGGAPLTMCEAIGLPMDDVLALKETYKNEGIPQAAKVISEELIDAFTIVGTAEQVIDRIQMMKDLGLTVFAGHILTSPGTDESPEDRLRLFADTVFPIFK
jgi:5,10-methylenetetrahydromethanopterin reductase